MNNNRMIFRLSRDLARGFDWALRIGVQNPHTQKWSFADSIKFAQVEDCVETPACAMLSKDDCQGLMDELWHVGFRPTEGTGSAGSLAATERHLSDMRALVFKLPPK